MDVSLGFFIITILVLFPGLIYRRLYFYGEFSKEFNSGHNLVGLLAISSIPGLVILIFSYVLYNNLFVEIDFAIIIDRFKDLNSPDFRISNSKDSTFNELIKSKVLPAIGFLYLNSFVLGSLCGRFIRNSNLDTKFKLLRFKNYWFYLFNGHHSGFKKLKHLKASNKNHLFTKADILIDSNSNTHLYSGIVVDYELFENDSCNLSKVYLQNAERYSIKENKRVKVEIPGTLLVVDCTTMKNINLTYIYEDATPILKSKFPNTIETIFSLFIITLIPFFIFRIEGVTISFYSSYFDLVWYEKLITYMVIIQFFSFFNPFIKIGTDYSYYGWKGFWGKVVWIIFLLFVMYLL
jgi:hypothetical protein